MQPNGVLAWNDKQAVILTTEQYKAKVFQPDYATQSGPMLVINGKINPLFLANSDSKKIRNGVGVKNNKLYFVISKNRVNFYSFAQFFQKILKSSKLYTLTVLSLVYICIRIIEMTKNLIWGLLLDGWIRQIVDTSKI
ncbi:hypothetical protein OCUAc20_24380 [Acinetobacter baumannii]|nr:hypothetical protein OCUAc20_24380 [Acinetobacter baumannii]